MDERPLLQRLTSRRFIGVVCFTAIALFGDLDNQTLLALAGVLAAYNLKDAWTKPNTT